MQIIGSIQIVTGVTSVVPTFLSCIALLGLLVLLGFTVNFAFAVRMCWGFRLCGGDHGLCPLDSHKPLKRLDRNFKCFGAVTFVWIIGFCAVFPPRLPSSGAHITWARPNKKIKNLNNYDTYFSKSNVLISTYPIRVVPEIFPDAA